MENSPWRRRRAQAAATMPVPKTSAADLWLGRTGSVAAIVMAIFAAGAFFYTVRPTYRAAWLDEQLAARQLELTQVEQKLRVRYASLRQSYIAQFLAGVGARCTGLLGMGDWTETLSIDVPACFLKPAATSRELQELEEGDRALFIKELTSVAALIEADRIESKAKAMGLPAAATKDPQLVQSVTLGEMESRFIQIIPVSENRISEMRLGAAQRYIVEAWRSRSTKRILELRELAFPD